ncbi:MAG: hypothetical protein DI626_10540 [Micavibrio aeruginosavorus]|uniref:Uncharacterized protein n=1 Tax=Micavibrio aeruginosavorus TaxID=349221 RepID=A0A2W5BF93_9BACT|nr:MAG: hypothetical protein DI626_10540 [Micavibrio aeruginosavorus]
MFNKKNLIIGFIVLLVLGSICFFNWFYVSGTWRYKMTVVVETPEGIKTGYAVREISNSAPKAYLIDIPEATNPAKVRGEAVTVDLGERGVLFATLKGYRLLENFPSAVFYSAFPYEGGATTYAGIKHYKNLKNAKAVLKPENYPVLVTYTDKNDATSIKPAMEMDINFKGKTIIVEKKDHFEEIFGQGVRLKEIVIETTDEPVTSKIESYLPEYDNSFWEWYRSLNYADIRRITPQYFNYYSP